MKLVGRIITVRQPRFDHDIEHVVALRVKLSRMAIL
jgi:hypothetical protein